MPYSKIFSTLTATGTKDVVATEYIDTNLTPDEYKKQFVNQIFKKKKFRSINAKEAQKIQGFPDCFIAHEDEKTAKKQFGNAVSPPVIESLVEEILQTGILGGDYEPREKARDFEQGTIMDEEVYSVAPHQKHKKAV